MFHLTSYAYRTNKTNKFDFINKTKENINSCYSYLISQNFGV